MSKPNTSRVSDVGKAHDDKLAKIMADREKKAGADGFADGLRRAQTVCLILRDELIWCCQERGKGVEECIKAIDRLIDEAEAGRIEEDDAEPKDPHGLVNQDSASEVAAMMGHGRVVCVCGKVIRQCRCPGPHKTVTVSSCTHRQEAGR